jgi:sulfite exporter TauE/SafE
MTWWAIFGAGLLAGATTCAVAQGGLLVGLIARQKKVAASALAASASKQATTAASKSTKSGQGSSTRGASTKGASSKGSTTSTSASRGKPQRVVASPAARSSATEDLIPVAGFLLGKLVILTLAGVVLGALGSFTTLDARIGGYAQLFAAAVMITFGLGAAGVPGFRNVQFTPPPSWIRTVRRSTRSQSAFAPFLLGLATVLIPCGVTISMMLLAATSGTALAGGAVMAVFVLGTAPLFTAYGFLTQRYVSADSWRMSIGLGTVVVLMGMFTLNASLTALGSPITAQKLYTAASSRLRPGADAGPAVTAAPAPAPVNGVQVLQVDATTFGYSPTSVAAKAGIPTRVVFHTKNTRSCIVYTTFPTLGKQVVLPNTGDTEVDLGTLAAGEVPISCSMGMYTGTIVVS